MRKRYLAIAALLALPFGQASAEVLPQGQPLFEAERHPDSLPTANYRGGKWQHRSNRWGGGGHGSWGGAWGGHHGKGCRFIISFVPFKKHPRWDYWLYRPEFRKVCPSPH